MFQVDEYGGNVLYLDSLLQDSVSVDTLESQLEDTSSKTGSSAPQSEMSTPQSEFRVTVDERERHFKAVHTEKGKIKALSIIKSIKFAFCADFCGFCRAGRTTVISR